MAAMRIRRFTDPQAFNEHITTVLAPRERENNLLLGIARNLTEKPDDATYMVAVAADVMVAAAVKVLSSNESFLLR